MKFNVTALTTGELIRVLASLWNNNLIGTDREHRVRVELIKRNAFVRFTEERIANAA